MSKSYKEYHSTLWKIQRINSSRTSYLFGTIHLGHPSALRRLNEIKNLISVCDFLALEHDLDQAKKSAMANMQMSQNLSFIIGQKKFAKARKICSKAFNVDLRYFETVFPLQTINYLSCVAIQSHATVPLDIHLWQIAKKLEKDCTGLESIQRTKEIFDLLDLDFQIKQLIGAIRNVASFKKKIIHTLKMYENQEINKIYKLAKSGLANHKRLLLYERNEAMVQTAIKLMNEKTGLFAVGAAHLWGKKGMINIFKQSGFVIKAM